MVMQDGDPMLLGDNKCVKNIHGFYTIHHESKKTIKHSNRIILSLIVLILLSSTWGTCLCKKIQTEFKKCIIRQWLLKGKDFEIPI